MLSDRLTFVLKGGDRFFGEEIIFQFGGEGFIVAPYPLNQHGGVLFLLVAIMF
jgi:hypothetical protein